MIKQGFDNEKIMITAYEHPDLDGVACAYAYSEFLNKNNKKSITVLFGVPDKEAEYVLEKYNISPYEDGDKLISEAEKIIIVDASDLRGISKKINPLKVIEVIDHRKIHEADKFENAKKQIELVGSAATLIAEKFYETNTPISKESAILLHLAIISNTINLKANVTTKRDIKIIEWIKNISKINSDDIKNMFKFKSNIDEPIKIVFEKDFSTFEFNDKKVGIAQLEIIDTEKFVSNNLSEILISLETIKKEKNLDYIFLSCVDLIECFNLFVTPDNNTQRLLRSIFDINFENNISKKDNILMRKEISPLIRDYLES